ncbi:CD209 antigen-like [Anabas testudineus]|uniref:C-type lectin domain-containing protein n=1 Tax=Anabas testudineus TaxID=64144 RepID=A0A3Q1IB93_ANATE|nr:CD209 antigen-like [Anabas testudineus]
MEDSQSRSEPDDEMSSEEKKIFRNIRGDGRSHSRSQTLGQGLFTKGGGPAIPPHWLVILCLALMNAVLLIAAVVIGIYCGKAKDFQISHSAATPVMVELNFLRNHSGIIKDKVKAQAALVRERANHLQLKMQVKQKKTITDGFQSKIETLKKEKIKLQSNKTSLEENCERCLPGWILLKSSCYYFSKQESTSRKNWQDSRADCVSHGGDLLIVNNLEEQQLICDNFPSQSGSSAWWNNGFWIGLTDVATEGTWIWVNNVTETESMYWRHGQPNRTGPQSGNCAAFYRFHDSTATWYNGKCLTQMLNWICEMQPR